MICRQTFESLCAKGGVESRVRLLHFRTGTRTRLFPRNAASWQPESYLQRQTFKERATSPGPAPHSDSDGQDDDNPMTNGSFSHFRRSSAQLRAPKERRRRAKAPRRRREGARRRGEGARRRAEAHKVHAYQLKSCGRSTQEVLRGRRRCKVGAKPQRRREGGAKAARRRREGGAKAARRRREGGAKAPQRPAKRGRKCEKDRLVIGVG